MKSMLDRFRYSFLFKIHNITIKQASIFVTFFIFVFTIIFAYLLIKENYYDYERALKQQNSSTQIEQRKKTLKTLLIKNTLAIATLAFIIFTIMLGFFKVFNNLLQKDMDMFLDFFQENAYNKKILNPNDIFFKEFRTMVKYANNMLHTISEQKSSLKELNRDLEDKVKAKTKDLENILDAQKEFLRYTVHETNTPLSVILTSLELYEMNHEKNKHLSKVQAAAKNIFNIYDDLSYLVKQEHLEYPKIAIDVKKFVKSRIDFFSEVASLSKLKFDFISNFHDTYIYFNETKLQRIIDNTLTNAIKYTYQNETIYVLLEQSLWHLDISVASHSQDIKDVDKIFDEYYRENIKTNKSIQGFGIGLRLVKNICDEEGVKILIKSDKQKNIFTYRFKAMGE